MPTGERQRCKARNQKIVVELKDKPCTDCGGYFPPVAMDFDHTEGDKIATISWMVRNGTPKKVLLAEIEKCELVCSNCHRVRTAKRETTDLASPS
jgi:hypothetical protein